MMSVCTYIYIYYVLVKPPFNGEIKSIIYHPKAVKNVIMFVPHAFGNCHIHESTDKV